MTATIDIPPAAPDRRTAEAVQDAPAPIAAFAVAFFLPRRARG